MQNSRNIVVVIGPALPCSAPPYPTLLQHDMLELGMTQLYLDAADHVCRC